MEALRALWSGAGLQKIEGREITVQRRFTDFDDYWSKTAGAASLSAMLATMTGDEIEGLKGRLLKNLPHDDEGRIVTSGRANAIKGRVAS